MSYLCTATHRISQLSSSIISLLQPPHVSINQFRTWVLVNFDLILCVLLPFQYPIPPQLNLVAIGAFKICYSYFNLNCDSTHPFIGPRRHANLLRGKTGSHNWCWAESRPETALAFADVGARVVCVARRKADVDAIAREINQLSTSGKIVDSEQDLEEVLSEAKKGKDGRIEKEKLYWLKMNEL